MGVSIIATAIMLISLSLKEYAKVKREEREGIVRAFWGKKGN